MTEERAVAWKCPDCKGEFDNRVGPWSRLDRCPWCGFKMEGLESYYEDERREKEKYEESRTGVLSSLLR